MCFCHFLLSIILCLPPSFLLLSLILRSHVSYCLVAGVPSCLVQVHIVRFCNFVSSLLLFASCVTIIPVCFITLLNSVFLCRCRSLLSFSHNPFMYVSLSFPLITIIVVFAPSFYFSSLYLTTCLHVSSQVSVLAYSPGPSMYVSLSFPFITIIVVFADSFYLTICLLCVVAGVSLLV